MTDKKSEDKDLEARTTKSAHSLVKRKMHSKSLVSKGSLLKKMTDTDFSEGSIASSSSLHIKRQSEFDKLSRGPRYQNTYRLSSKRPFKSYEVYRILENIVLREIQDYPYYDSYGASRVIQTIATDVRTTVRSLNYDRYKICVLVILGEKKLQGFQCAFRALWDQERDAWAAYLYQTRTYFVSCSCYGLYHD